MRIALQPSTLPTFKPLKTSFRAKGFDYALQKREGDVAMFEQSKQGFSRTWSEVVIVQRHGDYEIDHVKIEAAETVPSTSQWGRLGWTFRNPTKAQTKFDELVKAAKDKLS